MTIQRFDATLQFGAVAFGVLAAASAIAGWGDALTAAFGLVAALAALAAYFTGRSAEGALEGKIQALETEQVGRRLSAEQLKTLSEHLRSIPKPSGPVLLMGLQGNVESIRLAGALKQAFEDAGLAVDGVWEELLLGGTGPGILIRQEKQDALGVGMRDALLQVGLDARIIDLGRKTQHEVEVIVGYRL